MENLIFHHLGIACRSINDLIPFYLDLGYQIEGPRFEDPNLGINCQFMVHVSSPRVELIEPHGESPSPIDSYISRGISIYQLAYICDDIDNLINSDFLAGRGILLGEAVPAIAFQGKRVCFYFCENHVIEIIERQ